MATGGLYGSSGTGALIAQPGSESSGLYGNSTSFGGTYFEWFVFQTSETQPATPTGGTWNFTTNANTPPTGWSSTPPSNPLNTVWVSIAIVNSKNTAPLVWSVPGKFAFSSGLPILFGNGAPQPGDGQSDQLYVQLDTTPQTIWAKETGTWTRLTGSTLYADLTSNQTIAGTKTFSSQIQGSISGTASNVTGTVAISNGGTGATTAASARAALGAAELGANADITSMTGVTGGISTPDFVQFDTGITPTVGVGKLQWDPTHGCMQVGLVGGNVNLQIGEETVAYIYNNTGSTITEGQVVRVVGSQGQRLTVALAQADGDPNSATILGMATENIANNSSGFITTQGVVNNLNTNGFADGTLLYLSPTVPGGVTATKPVAPQHLVWIGYVVKGNSGGAGSIYIHTQNGYELDELHNVKITDPVADNSFLVYDATLEVWQNEAPSAARTSLGLGSAAVLNAGVANGVATLDAGGTVPLSQIPASIQGGVSYQGTWNATTNTPTLTSSVGTKGYYYVVSVAGSTNLNGITSWNIGDWAIYNGTAWEKIDNTDAVTSVNGYTGTVVLNYADVGAPSTTGVNATGTWGINVTGNAATATTAGSATTATTATNVSGGTASVTTLTTSSTVTLNGGTANGVAYLNGSKVLTTGSALTFDGTSFAVGGIGSFGSLNAQRFASNPQATLTLGDNATPANDVGIYFRQTSGVSGFSTAGAAFAWYNASPGTGEQMRLTSTGLGIGTSSPAAKLDVKGGSIISTLAGWNTLSNSMFELANPAVRFGIGYDSSDQVLLQGFDSNNAARNIGMQVYGGNVGIGTNSPGAKLNVVTAGTALANFTGAQYSQLRHSDGTRTLYTQVYDNLAIFGTESNTPLSFVTNSTVKATIDSSGNLGIGTSSPLQKLDVRGRAGVYGASDVYQLKLSYDVGTAGFWLGSPSANALAFYNDAGTERMRLDSSGNLGLGVTPTTGGYGGGLQISRDPASNLLTLWTQPINTNDHRVSLTNNAKNTGVGTWAYNASSQSATMYQQMSGAHQWWTAGSGTAGNAISFSQVMTLTAAGGLSVGSTTDPGAGNISVGSNKFFGLDSNAKYIPDDGSVGGALYTGGGFRFFTGGTERARIDSSGNLLVGTTSVIDAGRVSISFPVGSANGISLQTSGATYNNNLMSFRNSGGTQVGFIYTNGTTTSYGTSSDYRLKENIAPMTGALAKVAALKPVTYTWKADGSAGEGFIAHELAEVCPQAVTGEKDAVDADGKPQYQGIDVSFLVGTLTAAIQEQQAIIEDIKTRLAALESN